MYRGRHLAWKPGSVAWPSCTWLARPSPLLPAHLVLHKPRERQVVEQVSEGLPDVCASILPQALIVEAINLGDLPALVVATKDGDAVPVADLEGHEQRHRLDRVVPSIDVIAHEQVVGVWGAAAYPEELQQVLKLAVDVSCVRATLVSDLAAASAVGEVIRYTRQGMHAHTHRRRSQGIALAGRWTPPTGFPWLFHTAP